MAAVAGEVWYCSRTCYPWRVTALPSVLARTWPVLLCASLLLACEGRDPDFESQRPTAGEACVTSATGDSCADGEICLDGVCFVRCSQNEECALNERCEEGACVVSQLPSLADAGIPDGCARLRCESPTPACHPVAVQCVACQTPEACGGASPICDAGRGECVPWVAAVCAPCNTDLDCPASAPACLETASGERVCLRRCDAATCEDGLVCREGACRPVTGTCTAWRSGRDQLPCADDSECVPLGATPIDGQCAQVALDTQQCVQPCTASAQCSPGLECLSGFCAVP